MDNEILPHASLDTPNSGQYVSISDSTCKYFKPINNGHCKPQIGIEIPPYTSLDTLYSWEYISDSSLEHQRILKDSDCPRMPNIIARKYSQTNKRVNIHFDLRQRYFFTFYLPGFTIHRDSFKLYDNYQFRGALPHREGFWVFFKYLPVVKSYKFYICKPKMENGQKVYWVIRSPMHSRKIHAPKNSNLYLVVYNPEIGYGTIYSMAELYTYLTKTSFDW